MNLLYEPRHAQLNQTGLRCCEQRTTSKHVSQRSHRGYIPDQIARLPGNVEETQFSRSFGLQKAFSLLTSITANIPNAYHHPPP